MEIELELKNLFYKISYLYAELEKKLTLIDFHQICNKRINQASIDAQEVIQNFENP